MIKRKVKLKENYQKIIDGLSIDETQKSVIKSTWLDYLLLMNKSAKNGWSNHNYSQIIIILLGLAIPIIESSKLNTNIFNMDLTIVGILSFIIAGLTTLNRQFGFQEKWRHYRVTAEIMRNEGDDFFALAGNYEKYNSHKDAFKEFSKTVTTFKRKEVLQYMENDKNKNTNQN